MYSNLKGKKLLILGAYNSEIEIINCAKALGIYTVVTDSHLDWNDAPAKYVSDEAWDISWSDLETLAKKCEDGGINGVIAGFSERRVANAAKLSRMIGTPFYTGSADLDVILNKNQFKRACINSGVEVPKHYDEGDTIHYPVIVKPVDNGGSRGISICYNAQELADGIKKAKDASDSSTVEIEEYIVADEVMIYYVVHNGIPTLSAMCDRYMHSFCENITQLPIGYKFPSKHLLQFLEGHDKTFQKLIKNLGIENGLIAFQSFFTEDRCIPFDPTYRLDGTMAYHLTDAINGSNVLKMLISYSLTGSMGDDTMIAENENPFFHKIGFECPVLLGKGTISTISGMESIKACNDILFVYQNHSVGETMSMQADFSQILCRIHLIADSEAELEQKLSWINTQIMVCSEKNEDMVIYRNPYDLVYGKVKR